MAAAEPHRGRGRLLPLALASLAFGVLALLKRAGAHREGKAAPGRAEGYGRPASAPSPEAVEGGFELEDARPKILVRIMLVGVAAITLSIGGLFILLGVFHAAGLQPPLTPQQSAAIVPPGPPLQADPGLDLARLEAEQSAKLATYQWLDARHSRARIPIERAMALTLGKPLDPPR